MSPRALIIHLTSLSLHLHASNNQQPTVNFGKTISASVALVRRQIKRVWKCSNMCLLDETMLQVKNFLHYRIDETK